MTLDPLTLFKSLADDTRLKIMLLINIYDEVCVCDLVNTLALSQPKISRHIAILRDNGLVEGDRRGKWVHYSLHPSVPAWVRSLLDEAQTENPKFMKNCLKRYEAGCTAADLC